jgi:hypothetical protein
MKWTSLQKTLNKSNPFLKDQLLWNFFWLNLVTFFFKLVQFTFRFSPAKYRTPQFIAYQQNKLPSLPNFCIHNTSNSP